MGATIHYRFRACGDQALVARILDLVTTEIMKLPVRNVGEITDISQVRFTGGIPEAEALACSLGLHLQLHFNVFELPEDERGVVERRILEDGNGLGFCVNVAPGCDPFRVIIGRVGGHPIWSGWDFTKTAWADDWERAHQLVMKMLRICEAADIIDHVSDEAGEW